MDTLLAIVPTAGVLLLFWLAIRGMLTADRRERAATARMEAEATSGQPAGHPENGDPED